MSNEFYIHGQVALITGGNVGMGRITAIELALWILKFGALYLIGLVHCFDFVVF